VTAFVRFNWHLEKLRLSRMRRAKAQAKNTPAQSTSDELASGQFDAHAVDVFGDFGTLP